ncbi:MAG: hypothetical protein R2719_02385 [Micropruina sp.]
MGDPGDRSRRGIPFPIRGIDSDNGSEFINHHLLHYCEQRKITFTRGRAGKKNEAATSSRRTGRGVSSRLLPLRPLRS